MRAALALLLPLTACGGGGSPAPTPPSSCTPHLVTIGLYGDSTNYGETSDSSGNHRVADYPELVIQRAMDQKFGAGAVLVSTHAIPGTTAADQLNGFSNKFGSLAPWPQGVDADIPIMNPGINDFLYFPDEDFAADLRKLYSLHHVVFETPLPALGNDGYAQVVRDTASALGAQLIDVNAYVHTVDWAQYLSDGIHPNDTGYVLLETNVVIPALVPMVAALRCGSK